MYIVPIAWLYVALMMAVVEATSSNGSVLGALITFFLYGLAPVALLIYLMGTPGRKRALKAKEQADSNPPDQGAHAASGAIPSVGKEP
jgi:mannose/fructose/N-acetylgalactosamine-specific phosphotransferase system component IID